MLAEVFARQVIRGDTTFERLPGVLRREAAEALVRMGRAELIPASYRAALDRQGGSDERKNDPDGGLPGGT